MKRLMKGLRKSKLIPSDAGPDDGKDMVFPATSHDDEEDTTSIYTNSPKHITRTEMMGDDDESGMNDCLDPEQAPQHVLMPQTPSQEESPFPPDRYAETRNLVKKFIADIWNRGELDLIPSVCSSNLRYNGNTARMVSILREALHEYHCEIHSMVVEDNKAFCRLRFTGKHVGSLMGYPPTHKTVAWMGATEFTCQKGKILKVWELGDLKSLEEQLEEARLSQMED